MYERKTEREREDASLRYHRSEFAQRRRRARRSDLSTWRERGKIGLSFSRFHAVPPRLIAFRAKTTKLQLTDTFAVFEANRYAGRIRSLRDRISSRLPMPSSSPSPTTTIVVVVVVVVRCVRFLSSSLRFRSFFLLLRPGLSLSLSRCVGAYEWGASLRDVTCGAGSRGREWAGEGWRCAEVSEKWVAGRTVRRWAVCRGYMTQHIDLSLGKGGCVVEKYGG